MNDNTEKLATSTEHDVANGSLPVASESDRRAAMRKIGRYSAYAAPAVLAVLSSNAVAVASDPGWGPIGGG